MRPNKLIFCSIIAVYHNGRTCGCDQDDIALEEIGLFAAGINPDRSLIHERAHTLKDVYIMA